VSTPFIELLHNALICELFNLWAVAIDGRHCKKVIPLAGSMGGAFRYTDSFKAFRGIRLVAI
jgi:hypothetical protein